MLKKLIIFGIALLVICFCLYNILPYALIIGVAIIIAFVMTQ